MGWLWFVGLVSWMAGTMFFGWMVFLFGFMAMVILSGLWIYFGLAPKNIWFTFVEEGKAKIVIRGGQFRSVLMRWKGYTFNRDWEVVEGRESFHLLGGLCFFGIWPLDQIFTYKFRWSGLHEDGTVAKHEEMMDSILLKDFVYFVELKDVEEKNMVPLTFGLLLTIRATNPYKALFRVQDWLELVANRIKPLFREYVAKFSYEEMISKKQAVGEEVWRELAVSGLIQEFEKDYGVKFKPGGMEMKDITPREEYQKAATFKYLAERQKEKRAIETVGTVIEMMARSRSKTAKEIQDSIETDPKLQREFLDLSKDLIVRQIAIDGRSFVDIRVEGAEGIEKTLLDLFAAWKRMPIGGQTQEEKPKRTKKVRHLGLEFEVPAEEE